MGRTLRATVSRQPWAEKRNCTTRVRLPRFSSIEKAYLSSTSGTRRAPYSWGYWPKGGASSAVCGGVLRLGYG